MQVRIARTASSRQNQVRSMYFGTIIAGVASLVVILTGVFRFIQWLRTPAHKLEAFVSWNAFKLPPQVETAFADQAKTVSQTITKFQTEHPKQNIGDDAYYRADLLGSAVSSRLNPDLDWHLWFLHGCWVVTVKNTGKKSASTLIFAYRTPLEPACDTTEKRIQAQLISPK